MTAENEQAALENRVRRLEQELAGLRQSNQRLRDAVTDMEIRLDAAGLAWEVQNGSTVVAGGVDANDGKGWVCEEHQPVQHRDKRPPWCNRCGRGPNGALVGVPGWLRRIAQEQSPAGERAREEIRSQANISQDVRRMAEEMDPTGLTTPTRIGCWPPVEP